jgi:hypothetical protein
MGECLAVNTPKEVLKIIFSNLDAISLALVCRVCKKWNLVGNDEVPYLCISIYTFVGSLETVIS